METNPTTNALARDRVLEKQLAASIVAGPVAPRHPPPKIGGHIYAFQRVSSTMEIAHALAAEGVPEGTLVWALRQEQGRGRLGRTWVSPKGGVYLSLILRPNRTPAAIPQLSLVCGLSVAEAIHELSGLYPSIRWPNDVLINGLKLCGILVEARAGAVVVGIGVNVTTNLNKLPEGATSLVVAGAPGCDFSRLTGVLCRRFEKWYDAWTVQGFTSIRQALRPWMGHFGQPVQISTGTQTFEGTASDLDESGRLLVRLDSGVLRAFDVGEVTLLR